MSFLEIVQAKKCTFIWFNTQTSVVASDALATGTVRNNGMAGYFDAIPSQCNSRLSFKERAQTHQEIMWKEPGLWNDSLIVQVYIELLLPVLIHLLVHCKPLVPCDRCLFFRFQRQSDVACSLKAFTHVATETHPWSAAWPHTEVWWRCRHCLHKNR